MNRWRIVTAAFLVALSLAATGCVETGAQAEQAAEAKAKAMAAEGKSASDAPATPPAEVFRRPAPHASSDDARVNNAKSTSDSINESLGVIRRRINELRKTYEAKVAAEKDLQKVADQLKLLVTAARGDCDAILRAAEDVRTELRYARGSYQTTADLYRERGQNYRDVNLQGVNFRMADEMDRLANDVPRRVRLTDSFIDQLYETRRFLADTERCLTDTKNALAILSAGPEPVQLSAEARFFRMQLEAFLQVVEEYQQKLFAPAAKKTNEKQEPSMPTPPPANKKPDQQYEPPKASPTIPANTAALARPAQWTGQSAAQAPTYQTTATSQTAGPLPKTTARVKQPATIPQRQGVVCNCARAAASRQQIAPPPAFSRQIVLVKWSPPPPGYLTGYGNVVFRR